MPMYLPPVFVSRFSTWRFSRLRFLMLWSFGLLGWGLAVGAGCGYTVAGAGASPQRLDVAIPVVVNQSREPELERQVTAALRRAVVQSHTLALVPARTVPKPPLIVAGVVRRFAATPLSFDASDTVVQYRLQMTLHVRVGQPDQSLPVLDRELVGWAEYLVVTGAGATRQNVMAREAAVLRLAQQVADQCVALLEIALG